MVKEPVFDETFSDKLIGVQRRKDHGGMREILSFVI